MESPCGQSDRRRRPVLWVKVGLTAVLQSSELEAEPVEAPPQRKQPEQSAPWRRRRLEMKVRPRLPIFAGPLVEGCAAASGDWRPSFPNRRPGYELEPIEPPPR